MGQKTYEEMIAEMRGQLRTRTGKKEQAQLMLMHGIGVVLGYWTESDTMTVEALGSDAAVTEFMEILQREADRVAKLFGFEEAWSN